MKIQRAYKVELDPKQWQRVLLSKHAGVARFAYNWALAAKGSAYKNDNVSLSPYDLKKKFNQIKDTEYPWIREVSTYAVQSAFDDLGRAFTNFFKRVKEGSKDPGYPKFKSKANSKKSFRLYGIIHVTNRTIQLPRIGVVSLKESKYLPVSGVKVLNVTVSESAGRWFASLQVEQEIPGPVVRTESVVGVDVGIKTLATCSDGVVYKNPKALKKYQRRIKHLNQELSRRKKGSANRRKTVGKLSRVYHRISCVRQNNLHNATTEITRKHTTVVLEDLNVKGMMKNHCLAGAVGDACFGEFGRQCEYKTKRQGGKVERVDRYYPSSKRCSRCGVVKKILKLSERVFECESCGFKGDRDKNAADNLKQHVTGKPPGTLNACGGAIAPLGVVVFYEAGTGRIFPDHAYATGG